MWKGKDAAEATYLSDQGRAAGFWTDSTRGLGFNALFRWEALFFKLRYLDN